VCKSLQKAFLQTERQLESLTLMRIRELLSDDEYLKQKRTLTKGKALLDEKLQNMNKESRVSNELTAQTFIFACQARFWFENGSLDDKKTILDVLGSNLLLEDKKLFIKAKEPFIIIAKEQNGVCLERPRLEPLIFGLTEPKTPVFAGQISRWSG
ncbi:MAG: Resolvase protein, partial [Parcubacteria group bacterium Athens1014_10]